MLRKCSFYSIIHPEPLCPVNQCILDESVVYGTDFQTEPASIYQTVVSVTLAKGKDTHA